MIQKLIKAKEEWKRKLNPLQYEVMVKGGTEPPFDNMYNNFYEKGTYHCVACDLPLFKSSAKFDSGTGWPSFSEPINTENVILIPVGDYFEVRCARCGLHLGHLFSDGPKPNGNRYCMNSVDFKFYPEK
jgi:peptide-methionine (R)-S-oxide reductase